MRASPTHLRSAPRPLRRRCAAGVALALAAMLGAARPTAAEEAPSPPRHRSIRVVTVDGGIEAALSAYVARRLERAKAAGDDCVVFRIDSPGGTVHDSTEIADAILALPKSIRTVAWVEEHAYSGAAMVALACDEIVMGPRGVIGDCQPILLRPEGIVPVGEKIETVLRAQFRRYAEDNGWPPLLAEKMVSQDMEVIRARDERDGTTVLADGAEFLSARDTDLVSGVPKSRLTRLGVLVGKDRLLTLTTAEAVSLGFVRRVFDTEAACFGALRADGGRIVDDPMTASERAGRWLLGFAGVLAALALLCATITIFGGIGTSTIVGVAALALLGLVTATADLAYGFPLLLLGVGTILLLVEAFVIPGFGIAGILGILSLVTGFLFLTTGFSPGNPGTLSWVAARAFLVQVGVTLAIGIGVLAALTRLFPGVPLFRRHLLLAGDALPRGAALAAATFTPTVGAEGLAETALRPAGRATLSGRGVDVTSEGDFVEPGTAVRVVRVEGARVVVRPLSPRVAPPGGSPAP